MPVEVKQHSSDFYKREFSLVVVRREDDKKPQTFEEHAKITNLQLGCIESLAFLLAQVSKDTIKETDPTNLQAHIETVVFLIMNFAANLHLEGDWERFLKSYENNKEKIFM